MTCKTCNGISMENKKKNMSMVIVNFDSCISCSTGKRPPWCSIRVWKWGSSKHMGKRRIFIVFVVKQAANTTLRCKYDWQMKLIKGWAFALGGKKISFKTCALSGPPLVCRLLLNFTFNVKLLYFADCKKKKKLGKEQVLRFYRNRNGK